MPGRASDLVHTHGSRGVPSCGLRTLPCSHRNRQSLRRQHIQRDPYEHHPYPPLAVALRKNGDIWADCERVVKTTGLHTTNASKTKAHRTQLEITELGPEEKRFGIKKKADEDRAEARKYHDSFLTEYAACIAYRQAQYENVVNLTQMLMIRTTEATINHYKAFCRFGQIETTPATKAGSRRQRNIRPLSHAEIRDEANNALNTDLTRPVAEQLEHHTDLIAELTSFWSTLTYRPTTNDDAGATWLELLILFELRTHHRPTSSLTQQRKVPHPLDLQRAIDTALHSFRLAIRHVIKSIPTDHDPLTLVKTCSLSIQRLRAIGVTNTVWGLAILPSTTKGES